MKNKDNATAHISAEYDEKVRTTIPYYDCFHLETINIVKAAGIVPKTWLDTGCGTGTLAVKALKAFPETRFILADPSPAMLEQAKKKLAGYGPERVCFLKASKTQDISLEDITKCNVITAIQSHHYSGKEERAKATRVCYDLLRPGGIYITFENIKPATTKGKEIGKLYWKNFQVSSGKDPLEAERHIERFGVEYFPITVDEHLSLLRKTDFSIVEILWYSYMQAGFYCIK
jgi:tRNA (cmo5U34)-methyltransferase